MGTEADTQEIPRIVDDSGAALRDPVPHEALFEAAMARIDAVTSSWQETLAGFAGEAGTGRHSAPLPRVDGGRAVEGDPAAAVTARADASRWRRHLAA